jgi:hypothetical protein
VFLNVLFIKAKILQHLLPSCSHFSEEIPPKWRVLYDADSKSRSIAVGTTADSKSQSL